MTDLRQTKRKVPKRKVQFQNKLLKYSTAAGTALALTNAADAGIAIVDVSGWPSLQLNGFSDFASFSVDLNGDAADDLTANGLRSAIVNTFTNSTVIGSYTTTFTKTYVTYGNFGAFGVNGSGANQVATTGGGNLRKLVSGSGVAGAISSGAYGSGSLFRTSYGGILGGFDFNPAGSGVDSGYVGLSFDISGNTHYAWLEVIVSRDLGRPSELSVQSAAYEDQPGVDIAAGAIPEPASVGIGLGLLALGAAGVRRMRQPSK